jgi:hypothetical protein
MQLIMDEEHRERHTRSGEAGERHPWNRKYRLEKARTKEQGEVSERLKEHAWKVCIRKRIEGSGRAESEALCDTRDPAKPVSVIPGTGNIV